MRYLALFALLCGTLSAQSIRPGVWKPSPIQAGPAVAAAGSAKAAFSTATRKAFFEAGDVVFPHLATGDGWETEFTLVNMSESTVNFDMYFYNPQGGALSVTLRELPGTATMTDTAFEITLDSGASTTVTIVNTTPTQLRTGWAILDYNTEGFRIGGSATFRQKIAGRADYEALIPMSNYADSLFLLPVNDTSGFITALALCNPASNLTANVTLQLLNTDGDEIARRTITLRPQEQLAVPLSQWFPQVTGRFATLFVESSTDRLSALGIRFNTAGGNSFSSVPIMNWKGFF